MQEEILKRLDALAAKLGVTAQYLWAVLIKQARVEMWADIAVAALWLCAAVGCTLLVIWIVKRDERDEGVAAVLAGLIAAMALVGAGVYAFAAVTEGINPDYWALKQIIATVAK